MSCTAAHIRSLLLKIGSLSDRIEGSYRSWDLYTTGQPVDSLQQKRKPVLIKQKLNYVVFTRVTVLSFHPVSLNLKQICLTHFEIHVSEPCFVLLSSRSITPPAGWRWKRHVLSTRLTAWLSSHYITFGVTTHFYFGSQFIWFISDALCLRRCNIIFWNP